nr:tetratricopeptide repeat protein [Actinomycetota bacterium]
LAPWVPPAKSDLLANAPLPIAATPFLGRTSERAALSALVCDADVRVVTLTGVAGTGKTRLAVEVASAVVENFHDGVAFVELAPLTDPELLSEFVSRTMGVTGASSPTLRDALASRHQLVVLDNFEHLLSAVPTVAELVASAPNVTFLVTSRAVLHLYGEHQFEVAPLPVPDDRETDFEAMAASPAVSLFSQRARAVDQSFRLDARNVGVVAEICRRLDGLPLAIELAAARTTVLAPERLLTRLASRLDLLTSGACDLPARHQSLQATLDWSLTQLADTTRRLFANLSVFMSGFRIDAAEVVGLPLSSDEVLDAVTALVDHSLLRTATVRHEIRFVMLETVRCYAESLLTDGESHVAHERALRYVVDVAIAVDREARGPRQGEWLDRADEELDNIRALLRWSHDHDEADSAATIAASLMPFWLRRGLLTEGQRWLDLSLKERKRLSQAAFAITLHAAGRVARQRGDITLAEQCLRESIGVYERLGDDVGRARSLGGLGVVAYDQGDLDRSAKFHRESLEIYGRRHDNAGIAVALTNLGEIARRRRQLDAAVNLHDQSASLFAAAGDAIGEAAALTNLAATRLEVGELEDAEAALAAAAVLWQRSDERSDLAECLELFTALAAQRQQPERAVRLAAAAASLRKSADTAPSPAEAERHQATLIQLRQATGKDRFTADWENGAALTADEAVALALDRTGAPNASVTHQPALVARQEHGTTFRRSRPK